MWPVDTLEDMRLGVFLLVKSKAGFVDLESILFCVGFEYEF